MRDGKVKLLEWKQQARAIFGDYHRQIFPWIFTLELSDDNVDHRDDYDQAVGLAGLLVVLAATISNVLFITCSSS